MVFWGKKQDMGELTQNSSWHDSLDLVLHQGGPGFSHFVITNLCDAYCQFCSFAVGNLKPQDIKSVSREDGLATIDILYKNGIRYLIFVGGEALLHKDILTFIKYTHDKGMVPMVCTNGSHLTPDFIPALHKAGLQSVIISIDAPSVQLHEQNRGLKNVCQKIQEANKLLQQCHIQTTASVTISKLMTYQDYDLLPGFLQSLGFTDVTFSYPLEDLHSSYLGFSSADLVHYTPQELIAILEKIKSLKQRIHVVNNTISLTEMQRFLRKSPQHFGCLGGYRYFYVDWNLDVYRCHFWKKPMCKIHDFSPDQFIRDNCQLCMIDCYRDPSVMQFIAVSLTDANRYFHEGKYWEACRALLRKNNFLALRAVLEQISWIRKM